MVCVEKFTDTESANELRKWLKDKGVESRLAVDPLASRSPALSQYEELALLVHEAELPLALAIADQWASKTRRAG